MKNIKIKLSNHKIETKENNILKQYLFSQTNYIPSNINLVNSPLLWNKGFTGKGITIAVIDTGCYTSHVDLKNNIIGGRNFTKEDNGNPDIFEDYSGHGTHCCGIIGANNHIKGIAPDVKLLVLKVLESDGNGNLENVVNAVNYAIDQKIDIINLSLGCNIDMPEFYNSIKRATENNIMVVSAIGNEGDNLSTTSEINYPSYYQETISVGAVDNVRLSATFSNSNVFCDCVAPGVNIISTHLNNSYVEMSGTSMACPHVAGILALLKEKFIKEWGRKPTYMELYAQLIKNTIDLGIPKTIQGNGLVCLK